MPPAPACSFHKVPLGELADFNHFLIAVASFSARIPLPSYFTGCWDCAGIALIPVLSITWQSCLHVFKTKIRMCLFVNTAGIPARLLHMHCQEQSSCTCIMLLYHYLQDDLIPALSCVLIYLPRRLPPAPFLHLPLLPLPILARRGSYLCSHTAVCCSDTA